MVVGPHPAVSWARSSTLHTLVVTGQATAISLNPIVPWGTGGAIHSDNVGLTRALSRHHVTHSTAGHGPCCVTPT